MPELSQAREAGDGLTGAKYGMDADDNIAIGTSLASIVAGAEENTALGAEALEALTSGAGNTAVGYQAGKALTSGTINTFVGWTSGERATTAVGNVGVGKSTLNSLTTGNANVGIGHGALSQTTTPYFNVAIGNSCLPSNVTGADNIGVGDSALFNSIDNNGCIAIGKDAMFHHLGGAGGNAAGTGADIIAIGRSSMINGEYNTQAVAIGANTLFGSDETTGNTVVGYEAGKQITSGSANSALGQQALKANTTGARNSALGSYAAALVTTGSDVVAVGAQALRSPAGTIGNATTTGARQTGVGVQSGQASATQRNDIVAVGYRALVDAADTVALGSGAQALHANGVALGKGVVTTQANQVMVGANDVEVSSALKGLVLPAPNASRYRIRVNNDGSLYVRDANFPGFDLELEATHITGLADGAAVSSWAGRAGSAAQATGANQPLYKTNIVNGQPVVRFDGADDVMETAVTTWASPLTLTVVGRYVVSSTGRLVAFKANGSLMQNSSDWSWFRDSGGSHALLGGDETAFTIVTLVFSSGTSMTPYINGVAGSAVTITAGDWQTSSLRLGASTTVPANPGNVDLAAVFIKSAVLSDTERLATHTYLSTKYGIVLP